MPAAVIIAEAPSGKIIFRNRRAQQIRERSPGQARATKLDDAGEFEIFHTDGRPFEMEEWPLLRSIISGEEVRDEEFLYPLAVGSRLWLRCNSSPIYDDEGHIVAGVLLAHDITEQKQAEERLRFQAHLLDAVGQAVIAIDMQGRITYWNHQAEELYGWSAQEVMERLAGEVLVSEDQEERAAEIRSELRAGRSWSGEFVVRRRDGTTFPAMVTDTPVRDERGELVGLIGVSMDITERKRAEEALQESNREIENILESITDAFYAFDREWRYTYINERALCRIQRAMGEELTREDLLGKNAWELFPEAVGSVFYQKYHEAVREQKPVHFETYSAWSDRWVEMHAYPSEEGLSVYYRDITERKRAEEQLAYHANLLENIHDAVTATDEQFVVTAWNKGAEQMFGWTADEVLGRKVYEVIPYRDYTDEQLEEALRKLAETGRRRTEDVWYRKDGTPVWAEALTVALRGEQGEISGYLSIIRDISERKRAQEEIERRTHQQAVVADLGFRILAQNDDLQSLLDEAATLVARTLGVEYSKVVELLPGGEQLLLRAGVGWREGLVGEARESAGEGSEAGYTLRSDEPMIMEDSSVEERFATTPLLEEHGVVSGMSVVIHGKEGPFGALCAYSKSHRSFSEDDANFLQAVANVLAAAIEREGAEERVEESREAERSRMARDLHDDVLQELTDALVEAQQIHSLSANSQQSIRLARLIATLERIGPQLRGAVYDLRLEGEKEKLFPELLETLVELHRGMAPESPIALEVHDGVLSGPLGKRGRQLLRILGEALTNVRRHSGAQHVRVGVGVSEEKLWAEVQDDGRGFDVAQQQDSEEALSGSSVELGIRGMRERAHALGGDLKISSDPERGTKVRFEMALKPEDEEPEEEEVRIVLVEDHAIFREALASDLKREEAGFEVVGEAGSLAEARRMLQEEQQPIDVAIIDLGLPDGYGGDLIKDLREAHPQAQALVLSATVERAQIARAVEAGIAGVINKTAHLSEVVDAVKRLRRGETLLPLEEVVELLRFAGRRREEKHEAQQAIAQLTPREREVLRALAEGLDSEQMAQRLHISLRTERNHMASILSKLGVHSQLQALVFAVRYGVVKIP